ncbi:MAG: hypothetical protein IJL26_00090 [Clostridia bacterium]|nr:hypothetical protein [Clostridia bacterium]
MGLSTCTLHIGGVDRAAVETLLPEGILLREGNPPWIGVIPAKAPPEDARAQLERLAKALTKDKDGAAALLFDYFDDELFECRFLLNGGSRASCRSDGSWAKLCKQLGAFFGDELPQKASRFAARCTDLSEQTELLEQTVGAALLDDGEAEPRRVPRGDGVIQRIKAREAALRKRPNTSKLTELEIADWPEDCRSRYALYRILSEKGDYCCLKHLLEISVFPHHPGVAFCSYNDHSFSDWQKNVTDHMLLYSGDSGKLTDTVFCGEQPRRPVWITKQNEPVVMFQHVCRDDAAPDSFRREFGSAYIACIGNDGAERWRFSPDPEKGRLDLCDVSPEGIVTLSVSRHDPSEPYNVSTEIYRIDGETGRLLLTRGFPASENLRDLVAPDGFDGFLYATPKKELVLLDGSLCETARLTDFGRHFVHCHDFSAGCCLRQDGPRPPVRILDLRTSEWSQTDLEIPCYIDLRLPDGRLIGVNEAGTRLTVFDPSGRVTARCKVPGSICRVFTEDGRVFIEEMRGAMTNLLALTTAENLRNTTGHIWRLDDC